MRTAIIISVVLVSFSTINATAQEQANIPVGISIAIKAGNAAELSKYMNSTVELLLLDKEDFYKKNVAETILKDFFNEYRTKDFIIRHQGAKNDAQYAIGILRLREGPSESIFCLKKLTRNRLFIRYV